MKQQSNKQMSTGIRVVWVTIVVVILLAACAQAPPPGVAITPPEDMIPTEIVVEQAPHDEIDDDVIIDILSETVGEFALSADEQLLFEQYIATGEIEVLRGADPVSVIKILIQSGVYGHFEREFLLFHPDTLFYGEDLEVYLDNLTTTESVALRQSFANLFFGEIDGGARSEIETLENGHQRMSVSFLTGTDELMTLSARTNDYGIWMVERFR